MATAKSCGPSPPRDRWTTSGRQAKSDMAPDTHSVLEVKVRDKFKTGAKSPEQPTGRTSRRGTQQTCGDRQKWETRATLCDPRHSNCSGNKWETSRRQVRDQNHVTTRQVEDNAKNAPKSPRAEDK